MHKLRKDKEVYIIYSKTLCSNAGFILAVLSPVL
tara:strand:- start:77 stop:178 length:102 start_codon:yes stop_codon:yes gene_type:complete